MGFGSLQHSITPTPQYSTPPLPQSPMTHATFYRLLADVVLVIHFAFVAFVILGLLAVWTGRFLRWSWVRNFWFRVAHLLAIGIVAAQALGGVICPLTTWE